MAAPIRRLKHELAEAVWTAEGWSMPHFGALACNCGSHLFSMQDNPVPDHKFMAPLRWFRIDRLEPEWLPS